MNQKKNPLLEVNSLVRGYPQSPHLMFMNFDFTLDENEFCILSGRSGIGKTTLLKLLIGHLESPKRMIFHRNEDIARYSQKETQMYRRKMGVIFQDYKLLETQTVMENISYPLHLRGNFDQQKDYRKIDDLLIKLGLSLKKHEKIKELSGGEKQKVALARVLITNPDFIIADEPTGNLDWESSKQFADLMIDLHKEGQTILLITHNIQLTEYITQQRPAKIVKLS